MDANHGSRQSLSAEIGRDFLVGACVSLCQFTTNGAFQHFDPMGNSF